MPVLSLHANRPMLWIRVILLTTFAFVYLPVPPTLAQALDRRGLDLICPLVEHERQRVLEDYQLDLELAQNKYQARRKVFEMVAELWTVRSIERERYLDYKRLRDRAKVRVVRLNTQILAGARGTGCS